MPIRRRVALAFTAAMALVLAGFGAFLYIRTEAQLDESINDTLELRSEEAKALAERAGITARGPRIPALDPEDSFAQVLATDGTVRLSTAQVAGGAALTPDELARARTGRLTVERASLSPLDGRVRILARPVVADGKDALSVVGLSLETRDTSLRSLALLLLIGSPVALIFAGAAGYWAAGRALSPVERMRREAADIGGTAPGARLAVPAQDDELRRLATTLNEMLTRLEGAIDRERRFVDDASHELRTPLALHKTELELAHRYAGGERELRAAIASGIQEVDRLTRLAEDLLLVARSGESGLALKVDRIEARPLLQTVAARFRARADTAERQITVEGPDDLSFDADGLRIEQAVTNMIDNALRHGAGNVVLSARSRDGSVRIEVTDEGPGWDAEFLPRAFERFSRGDKAREGEGAGLGLAIVQTVATAHGGAAGAANAEGGGAAVWVDLPVRHNAD